MKSKSDLISVGSNNNNSRNIRKSNILNKMGGNSFRVETIKKSPPKLGN